MNDMVLALEISALGMGLVFAAIILLWWMMSLLTAITAEKDMPSSAPASSPAEIVTLINDDLRAQAAAVAVAIALAEQQTAMAHLLPEPPTTNVSPWQMGTRTRQLYQKGPVRRPRKIG